MKASDIASKAWTGTITSPHQIVVKTPHAVVYLLTWP